MSIRWNRRQFVRLINSLASVGILESVAPALALMAKGRPSNLALLPQVAQVPNNAEGNNKAPEANSIALQMLHDTLNSQIHFLDAASIVNTIGDYHGYNGPEIRADYSHQTPLQQPEQNELEELDGAQEEDFPSDYMRFNPQTGMFDGVDYWIP